jgi:hypothetical protein
MTVAPAERRLNDAVHRIERQVRPQIQPPARLRSATERIRNEDAELLDRLSR